MYTTFERKCIETLAKHCPDLREPLEALADRLVDLHPIARKHYYHPDMHGSWSIKAIMPTIAREASTYSSLGEVQDGMGAPRAYAEATASGTTPERRESLQRSLLEYCKHDTMVMVRLARFLASGA